MSDGGLAVADAKNELGSLPRPTLTAYCSGCGHPEPTGFHIATCAPAQRRMRAPIEFTPIEEACPHDGQSLAWHLASELGPDGQPRTNAAFIGCEWPAADRPNPPAKGS